MIQINVALPNPHSELLTLLPSCTLQDVETKAQAFWKKCPRFITASDKSGALLLPQIESLWIQIKTLEEAESALQLWYLNHNWQQHTVPLPCGVAGMAQSLPGVIHAVAVTARQFEISVVQIQASNAAFAAILEDGSVVAWGHADIGGDSSLVRDQLKSVVQIQATNVAFAAILEDGSVVTCGHADIGGGQFGSSRSAQECRADSSHKCCLCCDSARWIRRCLGS